MGRPDSSRGAAASLAVLVAFAGLGLAGVLHHEPWRDELEIWLIARDSASLPALLRNMGTEGHPLLWYFVNFALTRATRDPLAMQLANLAIGSAAALVFFRAAPFGLPARLLFVFSYYALFEFTVIARSYALELLLLFSFCAHATRRGGHIDVPGAALLALLAHTNLFGTIAVAALVAVEAWEMLVSPAGGHPTRLPALGLAGAAAALGFAHVLVQALALGPSHAGAYRPAYDLGWFLACVSTPAFGALPLPDPVTGHAWNSSAMGLLPAPWNAIVPPLVSLALITGAVSALRQQPGRLATFLLGLAPMLTLVLFVWYGSQRHHGQPFLWFLACAWLAGGLRRPAERVLAGVLALQVLAGAALLAADFARPFSSARAAARWLEQPENADAILVGSRDYAVQPIAAWTSRPIYYPDQGRFGTFMSWGPLRREVGQLRIESDAADLVRRERRRVLLVLSGPPGELALGAERQLQPGIRARYVARFDGAIVLDENYRVFSIEPARSPLQSPR